MKTIAQILSEKKQSGKARYNRHEFQAYGNLLAEELKDEAHRALYIKYAKTMDRKILEKAREFIKGVGTPSKGSRAKLFMWKLKLLREGAE